MRTSWKEPHAVRLARRLLCLVLFVVATPRGVQCVSGDETKRSLKNSGRYDVLHVAKLASLIVL